MSELRSLFPPKPQRLVGVELNSVPFKLSVRQDKRPHPAVDQLFYLVHTHLEVFLVDVADDDQVNDSAVAALGVVAGDEGQLQLAQALEHLVNDIFQDLIDAQVLVYQALHLII